MRAGRIRWAVVGACALTAAVVPTAAHAATPSLSVADVQVTETNAAGVVAKVVVRLSATSNRNVTMQYTTANGSAKSTADYTAKSGQLLIPAGSRKATVKVPITGDDLDEAKEQFSVTISDPARATIADGTGLVRIVDDDPTPTVSIGDPEVDEGAASETAQLDFPITLSHESGRKVTVAYNLTGGTAGAGDRGGAAGTFVIPAGSGGGTVGVDVFGDGLDEADETVVVTLSNPTNALLGDGSGTGTILDDDGPSLSVSDELTTEGNNLLFDITLDSPSQQDVEVTWQTSPGTATAGTDYTTNSGTVLIGAGAVQTVVQVATIEDATDEVSETVDVTLSDPVEATLDDSVGTGTILDDDGPSLSISNESKSEGWSGTSPNELTFDVALSAASVQTVTVDWATSPGTATNPSDFVSAFGQLSFAPGETLETVTVTVNGDLTDESNEKFTVALSNPSNATISDGSGDGFINDDDCTDPTADDPANAVVLTSVSGDSGTPIVLQVGSICAGGSDWYRFSLVESSGSTKDLTARIDLDVNDGPAQTDGDLDLGAGSQASGPLPANEQPGTADEEIVVKKLDGVGDDTTDVYIKISTVNGSTNGYSLSITGNVATDISPNLG